MPWTDIYFIYEHVKVVLQIIWRTQVIAKVQNIIWCNLYFAYILRIYIIKFRCVRFHYCYQVFVQRDWCYAQIALCIALYAPKLG